jgi:hypothetical protein
VVGDEAAVWAETEKMAMAKKKNSLDIALEAMIAAIGEQQYSKLRQKTQGTNRQREGKSSYCITQSISPSLHSQLFEATSRYLGRVTGRVLKSHLGSRKSRPRFGCQTRLPVTWCTREPMRIEMA